MDASKAYLDGFYGGCDKISLLELVKVQAQVLLPVIHALRKELGAERANQIVTDALRGWSREIYRKIGEQLPGQSADRFSAVMQAWTPKIGSDVDIETIRRTPEHSDFNITRCRYADFFRQLGEPDLGALLLCESDIHLTEQVGRADVRLERTQTIMKGAKYCDFRWSIKRQED